MNIHYIAALLLLCAENINGILVNVALGKKSSQYTAPGYTIWPSSNANDGVKECQNVNSTYLSLSGYAQLPWWKLDLGGIFQMHQINIFGRKDDRFDQLQGFRLYLSLDGNFTERNIAYVNTAAEYNKGNIIITNNLTGSFQFIKLDLPHKYRYSPFPEGPIVLCEVEILVKMKNIAVHKPVTMSSRYSYMTADKSVDGNSRRDADRCSCCSHSSNESNPWLTVDLLHVYEIFQIRVAGRSDSRWNNRLLTGLKIFTKQTNKFVDAFDISANASDVIVTLPQGLHSRYITLRRPAPKNTPEWYLVVCEVEVYVRYCKPGSFGNVCQHQCGHCRDGICKPETGECPNRTCMIGWSGNKCATACGHRTFGKNCSSFCHCLDNTTCNTQSGICQVGKCDPGWRSKRCDENCKPGSYGNVCQHQCGHCRDGICKPDTGECPNRTCMIGWSGNKCATECDNRTFGNNCSSTCNCLDYTHCNSTTGECDIGLCDPGWQGPACDQVCNNYGFGYNCSSICRCLNDTSCNSTTGECDIGLCDSGWHGSRCDQECENRTFGYNCSSTCHCLNETGCNTTSGQCDIGLCESGWKGPACDQVGSTGAGKEHHISTAVIGRLVAGSITVIFFLAFLLVILWKHWQKQMERRVESENDFSTIYRHATKDCDLDCYETIGI